jgi:ABC-type amino acid transport substrate-binding protein
MPQLVEVEMVSTGRRVWLTPDLADQLVALGRVRHLVAPRPDANYAAPPGPPDLVDTWQGGRFLPSGAGLARLH